VQYEDLRSDLNYSKTDLNQEVDKDKNVNLNFKDSKQVELNNIEKNISVSKLAEKQDSKDALNVSKTNFPSNSNTNDTSLN